MHAAAIQPTRILTASWLPCIGVSTHTGPSMYAVEAACPRHLLA